MNDSLLKLIQQTTDATEVSPIQDIQNLWSGYGSIVRYGLKGCSMDTVIVKQVNLSGSSAHPRGWNSDLSHQRKLKSYQVEVAWYDQWGKQCDKACRIPDCLGLSSHEDEILMILEDLDAVGFAERRSAVSIPEIYTCLSWLANFHATFMERQPTNLWSIGTYWHLATRPDELAALQDKALKEVAEPIDKMLQNSPFQTIVHGDAKLANFCFSQDGESVAAVDFQYVGGGCGIKDVAYFIGSCLDEVSCERLESQLLDFYFEAFGQALYQKHPTADATVIEQNWRTLYPIAWTDFHRFLKGWSPGHWKINSYSERLAQEVITQLTNS
ncbi:MAG: phosphotransferase [Methylococcaceae bacterium]